MRKKQSLQMKSHAIARKKGRIAAINRKHRGERRAEKACLRIAYNELSQPTTGKPRRLSGDGAPHFSVLRIYFCFTGCFKCFPALIHRVHIFTREPLARRAHWRLGWRRRLPIGLNCVARTRLEYPPPTCDPFSHTVHCLAILCN